MTLKFQSEPLAPLLAEGLEDLLIANWEEADQNQDVMSLCVDWPKYLMLERVGAYHVVTARAARKLVGYAGYFVQPHTHHMQSLWAINDVLYLDPEHRKGRAAFRFLAAGEEHMRGLGAKILTQSDRKPFNSTSEQPSATLGDLLLRSGYTLAEKVYAKLL